MADTMHGWPGLRPVLRERFSDLDEMAAAMRSAAVEFIPLEHAADFDAELVQLDLGRLTVQAHSGMPPHLARLSMAPDIRPFVLLRDGGPCAFNGHLVGDAELLHFRPATEHFVHVPRPVSPVTIALSAERVTERWRLLTGEEPPRFPGACQVLRPSAGHHRRLVTLVESAIEIATRQPDDLDEPGARHALAEAIESALIQTVHEARHTSVSDPGSESYGRIVARADDVLRSRVEEPVYVAELCAALQVPERTLRRAFERTFSISPIRYLKLRRLGLARRALCKADPARARVSEIAARYGFLELGRFAGEYRRMFGEKPSETLRRARSREHSPALR